MYYCCSRNTATAWPRACVGGSGLRVEHLFQKRVISAGGLIPLAGWPPKPPRSSGRPDRPEVSGPKGFPYM